MLIRVNSWLNSGQTNRSNRLLFLTILSLGILFRFFNLGTVRHGYDEGYPAYDALRLLDGGRLLLTGQPSSVFLDNPPLLAYLQAIPLLLWRSPWAVYIFITALNTAAIWFVYRTGRELLGERGGLLAAFLLAVNPWMVYFSQLTWHQSLLPLLTAVIAWGLWPAFIEEKGEFRGEIRPESRHAQRHFLIAGLALTALTQTYVQALGILAQIGPLLLLFWQRVPRRAFYGAAAVFLLALSLYSFGLVRLGAANQVKLETFAGSSEFRLTGAGLAHSVRLVTGSAYEPSFVAPTGADSARLTASSAASFLLALLLAAGCFQALLFLRHPGRSRRLAVVLLTWFGVPVLLTTLSPYPVHPHYLLLTSPAGYLLAALGLSPFLANRRVQAAVLILCLAAGGLFFLQLERVGQSYRASPTGPAYNGWTLETAAQLGQRIRTLSSGSTYPRPIYAQGNDALLSSISSTYLTTLSQLDYPHYFIIPGRDPLLYVLLNETPPPPLPNNHYETFPDQTLQVGGGTQVFFLRILPATKEEALLLPEVQLDWTSDAGLTLLGYTLRTNNSADGRSVGLTTYWRVEAFHPDRAEWFVGPAYHLQNAAGQILVNINEHPEWGYRWQMEDIYVEQVTLPLPGDLAGSPYTITAGLFDPIHQTTYFLNAPDGRLHALHIPLPSP